MGKDRLIKFICSEQNPPKVKVWTKDKGEFKEMFSAQMLAIDGVPVNAKFKEMVWVTDPGMIYEALNIRFVADSGEVYARKFYTSNFSRLIPTDCRNRIKERE